MNYSEFFRRLLINIFNEGKQDAILVGDKVFIADHNSLGSLSFVADGLFDYNKVIELNKKIGYSCRFGESNGYNVAIIGIANANYKVSSFKLPWEYGKAKDDTSLPFINHSDEKAKSINNYILMGFSCNPKILKDELKYISIEQVYDSRYNEVNNYEGEGPRTLRMNYKLSSSFSFDLIEKLLKTKEFRMTPNCTYGIQNGLPTAIIGYSHNEKLIESFQDVWEFGKEEPPKVDFTILSDDEASKIENYVVYGYDYKLPGKPNIELPIEKVDRSFDPRFDYYENGYDYRLHPIEGNKNKVLEHK